MLETLGWLGSLILASCGVPLAWQAFKQKHMHGTSGLFITWWLVGELLVLPYVVSNKDYPLVFNYGMNVALLAVVVRYKVFPKN